MDSNNPMIFDISSDEETAFDEPSSGCCDDDHDWLTQVLETVGKETADSDDVIVVGEYIPPNPKLKSNKSSSTPVKEVEDDDCVVLDGDPDKPVDVVNETAASDGDDVLVVGEKGQIACRDYPHPRHLCAKFPFNLTPHESHCNLCHCYVCDTLAPCVHWGTGVSSINHCHATDKLPIWTSQRENFRIGKNASLPVPKFPNAVAVSQAHQVASIEVQLAPNLLAQNQVCRPNTIRACSSARMAITNMVSQSRNRRPGCVQGRNGLLPRAVSQQASSIHNNAILRDRGQQCVSSNTMFKRSGIIRLRGPSAMNQSMYGSSNMSCASVSQYARNVVPLATANVKNPAGWQVPNIISESYTYPSPSQPNVGSVNVITVAPRPEVFSQPIPHLNDVQNVYQFGNQTQNVVDPSFFEFDLSWINSNPSSQQASAENVHLHGTGSNNEPTTVEQFSSQFDENIDLHPNDHDYHSFLLGQSEAVVSEDCVPADLNVFSPEPSGLDVGMLSFDFETSWNSLAHV